MTPEERTQAIYAAVEGFYDTLEQLKVESSAVAVSIDDTPVTGYCVNRIKGNSMILADMIGAIVKALPVPEFRLLLFTMATSPNFAANRGEDTLSQDAAIKPTLVN